MNSKKPVANWISTTLADNIEIKHGYAFKSKFFTDKETDNILLTPGNVEIGGGFKSLKFKYYNGPIPEEFVFNKGDIFVAMTDLSKNGDILGYPAKIPCIKGKKFLHNQRLGKVIFKDGSVIAPNYLYWIMRTREYRHHVLSSASGTTVKHTSPDRILSYSLKVPKIPEQILISKILDDLEKKITLNTKINKVLEEIAQAIFKHWFIDFEFPVVLTYPDYISEETKKELMKYGYKSFGGLPAPEPGKFFVYALECEDGSIYIGQTDFLLRSWHEHVTGKGSEHTKNHKPVRFVYWEKVNSQNEALEREKWLKTDLGRKWLEREISNNLMNQGGEMQPSPLGPIPKGWEVSQISEFGKVVCGKTPPKKEKTYYDGGQIPFIKIPDMHNQIFIVETSDKLTEKAISYMRNKLIPTGSICVSCIATVGKVALTAKDSFTNQQINSIIPKEPGWSFYLYFMMKQKEDELNLLASGGSATLNLNTGEFLRIKLLKPQKCIAQEFENLVNPLFVKILKNQLENLTLSNFRDTLLPKLMSGEIRVTFDQKYNITFQKR